MKLELILKEGESKFSQHNIENPRLNIGIIIEEVTGIRRLSLPLHFHKEISSEQISQIRSMIKRRCQNEPLQYILGYTEFYGFKFKVRPDVLIPRPETEYLIERIQDNITNPQRILDIGTGSGAIAITLKKLFPDAEVLALDISPEALKVAQENAILNNVEITFIQADIYTEEIGKFDLLVSNPPYVTEEEYAQLPSEVKHFEPIQALVGSESGLFFYRKILELASSILNHPGAIFFEIGEHQAQDIKKIASSHNLNQLEIIQDLAGKDRIIYVKTK
ncbi:peptide chain release factor N(5)-glutamine methyltransferase [bacterium]|nr:peptide chain release factor N(5)-glutamine methyltransferase [bacterium]